LQSCKIDIDASELATLMCNWAPQTVAFWSFPPDIQGVVWVSPLLGFEHWRDEPGCHGECATAGSLRSIDTLNCLLLLYTI